MEAQGLTQPGVMIKGIRRGLLVSLPDGDWSEGLVALETRLDASTDFFRERRFVLDVGPRELTGEDVGGARALLAEYGVELWALLSTDVATEAAARNLGLITQLESPEQLESGPSANGREADRAEDLVARRTLRSGQRLLHPGSAVVIGDLNSGSEVVAGGDIVVWGRARGLLHAEGLGNESAVICALVLAPTQLRIAHHIARSPDEPRAPREPEITLVREGRIVALPWHSGEPGRTS